MREGRREGRREEGGEGRRFNLNGRQSWREGRRYVHVD